MKNNIYKTRSLALGIGISLMLFLSPNILLASGIFVPCDNNCGFNDLMTLAYNVVHFLIFTLFLPLAAILFMYAGFLFITSGGSEENVSKAKKIFGHVAIGLIVMLCAWLIVKVILVALGIQDGFSLLNNVGK